MDPVRNSTAPRALAITFAVLIAVTGSCIFVYNQYSQARALCAGENPWTGTLNFNDRTYCADPIAVNDTASIPVNNTGGAIRANTTNATFLGFDFSITFWTYGFAGFALNTTVVEPNGTAYHGGPFWMGGPRVPGRVMHSNTWFTPDNQSGVYAVPNAVVGPTPAYPIATVMLLVQAGV